METKEKKATKSKTKFGHFVGTQAGAIDEALISAKKAMTLEELSKKLSLSVPRIKSHIRHLETVKKLKFEIKEGAYLLVDK